MAMVMEYMGFERNGVMAVLLSDVATQMGMFLGIVLVISALSNLASFAIWICRVPSKSEQRIGFEPVLLSSIVEM